MQPDEPKISLYKSATDKTGTFTTPAQAIAFIKGNGPDSKQQQAHNLLIAKIRKEKNKDKRTDLKKQLSAVTWSGLFTTRGKNNLVTHSGIICIDLDALPDATGTAIKLQALPQIWCIFISPSGNGLKLLFKIDINTEEHEGYFRAIAEWLLEQTGIEVDESGKDVSRLCFLSHDPDIYVNDNAPVLVPADIATQTPEVQRESAAPSGKIKKAKTPAKQQPAAPAAVVDNFEKISLSEQFDYLLKFTDQKATYADGTYNRYLNFFSMNCKSHGIEYSETESFCLGKFTDYEARLMVPVIRSVYEDNKIQFGQYSYKFKKSKGNGNKKLQESLKETKSNGYNEVIKFWYEIEKEDKDTGKPIIEVRFDHDKITYFLANNGFKRMVIGETYQFVQIKDNMLTPVAPEEITAYIYQYLDRDVKPNAAGIYTDVEDELYEVRKMFKRGAKTYCNREKFIALPLFTPNLIKDDENTAYLYFKNCFVEVTKAGIKTKPYSELKGQIWLNQIQPRDFTQLEPKQYADCVYQRFLSLAIVGAKDNYDEVDKKKFLAAITGIGYCLHRFKDSTITKAVVTVDKQRRGSNDSNGRTGKSLYFKAISQVLHTCIINGKAFKFDSQYPFGTLKVDHSLAVFNDVKKNFDFEELFHYITEDWDIKRLYENPIVIPFEDSAKIGVATNFSLKGNGDSFHGRQHIIEFDNYFTAKYTPLNEFKHSFFRDWEKEQYKGEWNKFYNFMINCIYQYLNKGLEPFPLENYNENKLIDEMGEDGYEWLCDNINEQQGSLWGLDMQIDKAKLFEKFKQDLPSYKNG